MKNGNPCPKCGRRKILYVPGGRLENQNHAAITGLLFGTVFRIARYVCTDCGFSEEWVDLKDDMEKVRTLYAERSGKP